MKGDVLVTGGAGFIGSHTAVELAGAGYGVIIVDDLSNADYAAVEGVRRITGEQIVFENVDCCDRALLAEVFKKYNFHTVIHFAGFKAVGESVADPLKYYRNNIGSMSVVLSLMCEYGVSNMVFSSSCTVYGIPDTLPVSEREPRKPAASPYGNTKQVCEDMLRDTVAASGSVRGISLRYFNPIGAHPSALIGELPRGVPCNLVPYLTQTAAGLHQALRIFGNDYDTPDGSALRDYIDVTDLARAHVHAVDRMVSDGCRTPYEIFNIGTGVPVSVFELIERFMDVNGVDVPYVVTGRRSGDVPAVWADTTLANSELGWRAARTLDQTLAAAWEWEKRLRGIGKETEAICHEKA